jgi:hypothetical protein
MGCLSAGCGVAATRVAAHRPASTVIMLAACIWLSVSCRTSGRQVDPWSFDRDVGLTFRSSDAICLSIPARGLERDRELRVVVTAASPQTVVRARIVAAGGHCRLTEVPDPNLSQYEIAFDRQTSSVVPAIAIVDHAVAFRALGSQVVGDVDGDGHDEWFRSCTSREGVHFSIWSDAPLSGRRRWHRYLYLGYDVEPTCLGADIVTP